MATTYAIPTASMNKIMRWYNARRSSGKTVQPWELEAAYKAELGANADRAATLANQNRSLSLQERSLADNTRLREEEIAANKSASTIGGLTNLGTTYFMGKNMGLWGKDNPAGDKSAGVVDGLKGWISKNNPWGKKTSVSTTGGDVGAGTATNTVANTQSAPTLVGENQEIPATGSDGNVPSEGFSGGLKEYGTPALAGFTAGRAFGQSKVGQDIGNIALVRRGGESERGAASGGLAGYAAAYLMGANPWVGAIMGALGGSKLLKF